MISARKLIAFVCVVAVLFAALAPSSLGVVWAIVVPLFLLLELVASQSVDRRPEKYNEPSFFVFPILPSRAPPLLGASVLNYL